ncbi:MAG: hypothetical protein J7497_04305 [Chitinophagaceae bacterium]|nr:hypothetical protein [Chitinophagaceae bacterium]
MKLSYCLPVAIIIASGIISCKKNDVKSKSLASLNVINAVNGGSCVKLNTNERDSAEIYNAKVFGLDTEDGTIKLYSTNDPSKPYYFQQHELKNRGTYSMFLFGDAGVPESLFVEENIPARYTDSIFGIRIINLASGSEPLNIARESDPQTNVFTEVGYKEMTDIVIFPLPYITDAPEYSELQKTVNFEVRDAEGVILTTYQLPVDENGFYSGISINKQRFKNITLVIKGIAGVTDGPDAFGVFPVALSY